MARPDDDILNGIIPVILAGGQGRRLRPLTSAGMGKPFLRLFSHLSLLQKTALRVQAMDAPAIVASASMRERIVADMAAVGIRPQQLFLEPQGRGTAPAVAVAAHYFAGCGTDPLILVLPSDHAISRTQNLLDAVRRGAAVARQGKFVLFGVTPSRPETGYGYIRRGRETGPGIFEAAAFVEKPGRAFAKRAVSSGEYDWNSGISLFSASRLLQSLRELEPSLHERSYGAVMRGSRLQNAVFLDGPSFNACPGVSLDHAVMEKARNLKVIPVDMGWRDLGQWPDLICHVLIHHVLRTA